MDIKRSEFIKTLTHDEQADYADLERIWDEDWEKAYRATSDPEMVAIVVKAIPEHMEPRFKVLLEKLKIHNSRLNINKI
jgi:hypothetical protein